MIQSIFNMDKPKQIMYFVIPGVVLIVIILAFFAFRSFNKSTSAITELHDQLAQAKKIQNQEGDEDYDDGVDDGAMEETDKYAWTQTEEEVELSIPLDTVAPIHKNEINVKITKKNLKITIRRENYLDDEFFSMVDADDCYWYLDNNDSNNPSLHISLLKAVKGKGAAWDYVLDNDASFAKKKKSRSSNADGMPSIHNLDVNDPSAFKAALQALKQ